MRRPLRIGWVLAFGAQEACAVFDADNNKLATFYGDDYAEAKAMAEKWLVDNTPPSRVHVTRAGNVSVAATGHRLVTVEPAFSRFPWWTDELRRKVADAVVAVIDAEPDT